MKPDETIMEMLARMLQPLVNDSDAAELGEYLCTQRRNRWGHIIDRVPQEDASAAIRAIAEKHHLRVTFSDANME